MKLTNFNVMAAASGCLTLVVFLCAGCGNKDAVTPVAATPGLGGPSVTPDVQSKIHAQEQSDAASRAASAAAMAGKPPPPAVKK